MQGRHYHRHEYTSVGPIQLKVGDIGGLQLLKIDRFCIYENRLFSTDISRTTGPRKMVHLSKFAGFYEINSRNNLLLICSFFLIFKIGKCIQPFKQCKTVKFNFKPNSVPMLTCQK